MSNPAEMYESYMVPVLFAPWASRLIQSAQPRSGEHVLDLACGTGIVARKLVSQIGSSARIVGLDCSANMLAVAQRIAAREDLRIEWRQGTVEELPFEQNSFDLVLCQFSLMFFADRQAALAQTKGVLKEGGRLVLSVWQGLDRHPFYERLHAAIQNRLGMSGVQQIFGLGGENELNEMMRNAGFQHVEIEPVSMTARFPDPEGFLVGEIAVDTASIPSMQHLDDRGRHDMLEAIRDEMKTPLDEVTREDHVVIPFHAHIVRAKRDR